MKDEGRKIVALVASRSGTGKTTLLESLVGLLKTRGYRVGAVKHSAHRVEVDRPGSDSWRLAEAGADTTVLAAKGILAVFQAREDPALEDCLAAASRDTDIVLVEGFKEMPLPKIELFRSGYTRDLHCCGQDRSDPRLLAVASDVPLDVKVPVLDLNDPEEIGRFIIERVLEGRKTE